MGYKDASKLTPWKKGQSGNPKGKPKGVRDSKTILKQFLAIDSGDQHPDTKDKLNYFEAIWLEMIVAAKNGDLSKQREILDRFEGKAVQSIDINNRAGKVDERLENLDESQLENMLKELPAPDADA